MMKYFTKSAFRVALSCPARLYYYNDTEHYANQEDGDEFLQSLAEGGFQVGELAKVYYGVSVEADLSRCADSEEALRRTVELLCQDKVAIAEAAFCVGNLLVRADIVVKDGNRIDLIEVKAKSWMSGHPFMRLNRSQEEIIEPEVRDHVYDVAFQKYVIERAKPGCSVHAYLMMADKSKVADVAGINQCFRVERIGERVRVFRSEEAIKLRNREHILTAFDVDSICVRILEDRIPGQNLLLAGMRVGDFVAEMARRYCSHERHFCDVSTKCFSCPFYKTADSPSELHDGYDECWMKMAGFRSEDFERPLLEDLWGGMGGDLRGRLLSERKYFLENLDASDFKMRPSDKPGLAPDERRLVQVALMTGRVNILPSELASRITDDGIYIDVEGLRTEMSSWRYPLHMIDFETTAVALPFYKGMRPYEQIAFQFSHHTISRCSNGTFKIAHAGQYINMKRGEFPNFEFLRELKRNLEGDEGSVFRYSHHENSILNAIREQLLESSEPDKAELIAFIETITHRDEERDGRTVTVRGPRDMIDLCEVVRKYYYHPSMKGSNSIKKVLPAILNSSRTIREKYSHPIYGGSGEIESKNIKPNEAPVAWVTMGPDGRAVSPYKKLPKVATYLPGDPERVRRLLAHQDESLESISNGGEALTAYGLLQFCKEGSSKAQALESALLRYCELDTLAMVFIWEYFNEMISK